VTCPTTHLPPFSQTSRRGLEDAMYVPTMRGRATEREASNLASLLRAASLYKVSVLYVNLVRKHLLPTN